MLSAATLLLCTTACSSSSLDCDMSAWLTGKYAAHYEIAKPEQKKKAKSARLGRRVYARATRYVMTTDRKKTNPCDTLTVNKELALLRKDDPRFLFTEINEYYAADGTLITKNTQEVTGQLSRSGRYIASDHLPILVTIRSP